MSVERFEIERPSGVVKYAIREGGHGYNGLEKLEDGRVRERSLGGSFHFE
jgi:hypothetical protein